MSLPAGLPRRSSLLAVSVAAGACAAGACHLAKPAPQAAPRDETHALLLQLRDRVRDLHTYAVGGQQPSEP